MKRCALRRPEERVTGEMLSVNKARGIKKAVTPVFVLRINVIFGKGLKAQCVTFTGICWNEIENTYVCIYLDKVTK